MINNVTLDLVEVLTPSNGGGGEKKLLIKYYKWRGDFSFFFTFLKVSSVVLLPGLLGSRKVQGVFLTSLRSIFTGLTYR